ncbi:rhomboid family intramembrane serine protease [bacterium SCSIO 12741]|nr:rhomboid family intramembrane serine protease [bacterium SCSIO 12741]
MIKEEVIYGNNGFSLFAFPFFFVALLWVAFAFDMLVPFEMANLGVYPRSFAGLLGIFTMPFVHGSLNHLMSNSAPLIVLGGLVYYFYRPIFYRIYFFGIVSTGIMVWLFARPSFHIGASGLVYALASFLFFSGMFRKSYRLMAISLLVVFLYGSLIWGIFPFKPGISWEGHLFGGISGLGIAIFYRKFQVVRKRKYSWEVIDEDLEIEHYESRYGEKYWEDKPNPAPPQIPVIRYFFKKKEED